VLLRIKIQILNYFVSPFELVFPFLVLVLRLFALFFYAAKGHEVEVAQRNISDSILSVAHYLLLGESIREVEPPVV